MVTRGTQNAQCYTQLLQVQEFPGDFMETHCGCTVLPSAFHCAVCMHMNPSSRDVPLRQREYVIGNLDHATSRFL